jgi:hypothetical protein
MVKLRVGERVAREATLHVGASALILDETGERVLLIIAEANVALRSLR